MPFSLCFFSLYAAYIEIVYIRENMKTAKEPSAINKCSLFCEHFERVGLLIGRYKLIPVVPPVDSHITCLVWNIITGLLTECLLQAFEV